MHENNNLQLEKYHQLRKKGARGKKQTFTVVNILGFVAFPFQRELSNNHQRTLIPLKS